MNVCLYQCDCGKAEIRNYGDYITPRQATDLRISSNRISGRCVGCGKNFCVNGPFIPREISEKQRSCVTIT